MERRRILVELYGTQRFLRDSTAQLVHEDGFGRLWELTMPGDEALVIVEVVNSTPEPDGSFHTYFLRVDPACRTAHAACAWTFGLSTDDYAPVQQT